MFDFVKQRSNKKHLRETPGILKPDDPVNYNSVLDYLTGLSKPDYDKLIKVANIYRNANKDAAKVIGVKDEPTQPLLPEKPTDEQVDGDLDTLLEADDLHTAFLDDEPEPPKPKKPQAAKPKTIDAEQ